MFAPLKLPFRLPSGGASGSLPQNKWGRSASRPPGRELSGKNVSERTPNAPRALQDIVGGCLLMLIAALALFLSWHLPVSGASGLNSGSAPRYTASALLVLGGIIAAGGFFREGEGFGRIAWRGMACILGGVLFFAFAIEPLGLVLTGVPLMLIAALASPDFRLKEAIIFAVLMTLFCAVLFRYGLAQAIPLWPKF